MSMGSLLPAAALMGSGATYGGAGTAGGADLLGSLGGAIPFLGPAIQGGLGLYGLISNIIEGNKAKKAQKRDRQHRMDLLARGGRAADLSIAKGEADAKGEALQHAIDSGWGGSTVPMTMYNGITEGAGRLRAQSREQLAQGLSDTIGQYQNVGPDQSQAFAGGQSVAQALTQIGQLFRKRNDAQTPDQAPALANQTTATAKMAFGGFDPISAATAGGANLAFMPQGNPYGGISTVGTSKKRGKPRQQNAYA